MSFIIYISMWNVMAPIICYFYFKMLVNLYLFERMEDDFWRDTCHIFPGLINGGQDAVAHCARLDHFSLFHWRWEFRKREKWEEPHVVLKWICIEVLGVSRRTPCSLTIFEFMVKADGEICLKMLVIIKLSKIYIYTHTHKYSIHLILLSRFWSLDLSVWRTT